MIKNIEQLKKERPDLVEAFENMSREELLKQCYLECIDAINMETRVSTFMSECTDNMSKTNYTVDSIKSMINNRKELDIDNFCEEISSDGQNDQTIAEEVRGRTYN